MRMKGIMKKTKLSQNTIQKENFEVSINQTHTLQAIAGVI